jgi:filamentous hemagglutinin family protein
MKKNIYKLDRFLKFSFILLSKSTALYFLLMQNPLYAQIVPDATLPINSQVNLNGNSFKIDGGTSNQKQSNLFHSFSEFSVPNNFEVFFNNSPLIQNIVVRVTGGIASNIDGQIRANDSASLFILNPNGILFGPNASINIGGSFIGTTANSVAFADGSEFSATNLQAIPQLTITIPVGLQFRQNQGVIRVQDDGHQLFRVAQNGTPFEFVVSPILGRELTPGLKVQSNNTLALIGGSVIFDGGILTAEEGRVELGSVYSGLVNFLPTSLGLTLDYAEVTRFGDIQLNQQSLIDVSGNRSGSIQIQGSKVSLKDGSTIFSQNQGDLSGRNLEIRASEILEITGVSSNRLIPSEITSVTQGSGAGGNISVFTPKLFVQDGGRIGTLVLMEGSGRGGNISVNAADSIELTGNSLLPALRASQIIAETNSLVFGQAGNITISTERLMLHDGANIVAGLNFGNGSTNLVEINATESILIEGIGAISFFPSFIGNGSLAGTGNIGSLFINTSMLVIRDGGNINTSVLGKGNAGDIVIKASNFVEVTGNGSALISAAQRTPPEIVQAFGLPEEPSGASGSVKIKTPRLLVADKGQVTVRNDGTGNAGDLLINADSIFLNNEGKMTASTESGKGGNITLNVSDILQLRNEDLISATARGAGNGGNININAKFLIAFPPLGPNGSDIKANAVSGSGGNIVINSQGIFGITERQSFDGNMTNDIDASSLSGPSGQIQISTMTDPNQGLIELPSTVVDPNYLVAQNPCRRSTSSEFTLSGRGGLSSSVNEDLNGEAIQVGLVESTTTHSAPSKDKQASKESSAIPLSSSQIVPAQGWIYNDKGEVVLVAYKPTITGPQRLQSTPPGCPI